MKHLFTASKWSGQIFKWRNQIFKAALKEEGQSLPTYLFQDNQCTRAHFQVSVHPKIVELWSEFGVLELCPNSFAFLSGRNFLQM